ncbi:nb-arc and ankyrin domain [Trichoderma arundinaceum]|uniref:Nb-arc and ankyrin domain n=1 Tax=Trichoderma arundinaceum TaxID=490622 RepID=A0A395NLU5_TRIAR|nr:nb-arc and ankyrin domain [Trichoderma arundinaceum]
MSAASFGSSAGSHDRTRVKYFDPRATKQTITLDTKSVKSETMGSSTLSAISKVLVDYPALESYATNRAFLHARLAQEGGADPTPIIRILHDGCYWCRWLSLQENITRTNSLLLVAVEQRLHTWVDCIPGYKSKRPPKEEINGALLSAIRRRRAESIGILISHGAQIRLNKALEEALKKERTRRTLLAVLANIHDTKKTNEQTLNAVFPEHGWMLCNAIKNGDIG